MDAQKTINEVLVRLFNEIWQLEEEAIITEDFKDISNNDMHVIEAIGIGEGNSMTKTAQKLNITVGSLTIAMNNLVLKEYVIRERSKIDRRIVNVKLTEKGEKAFYHHENYHKKMVEAVLEHLDENETVILVDSLEKLMVFFRTYNK
ncbi:MAG TPA: MarR family winged helix-turn-helix transcriptional regulator [Anaerovoracaceae bacterium]|nr:MarR family winged helix-turn-helix transcriptional regulator [Anaerovoracaceae bacterium]